MTIDPRFICASDLELYLVDKTTGLPLSGGTVTFYSDLNRAEKKKIYTISGTPPNYSFVELPNPSELSAVGTFQDEGNNNVVPYYYPYDADGELELYYITVESSTNVPQFTREAWPPAAAQAASGNLEANAVNYIPNGQFLAHTNVPGSNIPPIIPFGQITQSITEIAQGGFNFHRPPDSSATDNVQFFRFGEYVDNPSASPRYAVQIVNSVAASGDSYKDLRIRFYDVNKFASLVDEYTFGFSGETFNSGNFPVIFNIIKYFGTGGSPSPTEVITVTEFTITSIETLFQIAFNFGTNEGAGIGTNNDDFVELALQFPTNITFGCQLTDFMMFFGNVNILEFPPTTNRDFLSRSLTAPTPNPDGSSLYLPLVLTKEGLGYDLSQVGNIEGDSTGFDTYTGSISNTTNRIICDGSSYLTAGYSSLGIPFSRLQSKLWIPSINQSRYGTGNNFVASQVLNSSASSLLIATNTFGTGTICADGTVSTGFTFFNVCPITNSGYGEIAYYANSTNITVSSISPGIVITNPSAGTSGFSIFILQNPPSASTRVVFQIGFIAATTLAGKYFTFYVPPSNTRYYLWFKVDGVGADPAPGGTGILMNLKSTYTAQDVCSIVKFGISGCQQDIITTVSGSSITAGSYFTFTPVGGQQSVVWYSINGNGTAPSVSGALLINVPILSSDTAAQVATKTQISINNTYFSVPNLQGLFLRGYDSNGMWDMQDFARTSLVPGLFGLNVGTLEFDELLSHVHSGIPTFVNFTEQAGGGSIPIFNGYNTNTGATGFSETRPINNSVQWLIRY